MWCPAIPPVRICLSLVLFTFLCALPEWTDAQDEAFEEALRLARAYDPAEPPSEVGKDVDRAIEYYQRAVALRPNHPDNMPLLARTGGWLLDMEGNRERQLEGLAVFEDILEQFEYMDYYEFNPDYGANSPQYTMIAIAIHAAETYQYLLREPESARPFYFNGMEMLNQTYWRRLEDWRNEPPPEKPSRLMGGPNAIRKWESVVPLWEKRQKAAASGEIFEEGLYEALAVKALVRKYGETYGNVSAAEVETILQPVIDAFPDSPFEKEARRIISNAKARAEATLQKEMLQGLADTVVDEAGLSAEASDAAALASLPEHQSTTVSEPMPRSAQRRSPRWVLWVCASVAALVFVLGVLSVRKRRKSTSARPEP